MKIQVGILSQQAMIIISADEVSGKCKYNDEEFDLKNDLRVFLTSNSQRNLLDETRDRCLYLFVDYPENVVTTITCDYETKINKKISIIDKKLLTINLMCDTIQIK